MQVQTQSLGVANLAKDVVYIIQGSRGKVIGKSTSLEGGNGAYHLSIFIVLCSKLQWDGTNGDAHP